MNKDPKIFIEHILESISLLRGFIEGVPKEKFLKSTEKQDAIVRRIEIIGEAVKNLPEEFKSAHSEIPWKDIAGMRDNLIHEYFGVDLEEVWKTIKEDIPDLENQIKKL